MAAALAAAARATSGGELDLATLIDAEPPGVDPAAVERLSAALPGTGELADRVARYNASTIVPAEALEAVATRLARLLNERAADDLGLPTDAGPPTIEMGRASGRFDLLADRLILDSDRTWTVGDVLRAVSEGAVPGGHLAGRLRPVDPTWRPSPQATVDHGMWTVGREVLLGDHELAHELGRIGRSVGLRWSGELIVAVDRARDDLAPAYAAAALAEPRDPDRLRALGVGEDDARRLVRRWEDPLARADCAARAAGPPLVRGWLVRVGQTAGLGRLLRERLTPSDLRSEAAGA